jgi:hypothetical protein
MKCITSPALEDTQIVSYMEGEADAVVVAHINECAFCRERAHRWTLLQNSLRKQLYRVTCPTPLELGDYHLGLLPASQKMVVAQHVRECPLCRRDVAELENFLEDLASEVSLQGAAGVLIARLIGGDTGESAPTFAALRGEAKGPIILEADGVVITLDVQAEVNGQASILGQLAADDQDQWTGAKVELQQADSSQLTVSMDDLGTFRFEEVRPGAIQIIIRSLYGIDVQIPSIDVAV